MRNLLRSLVGVHALKSRTSALSAQRDSTHARTMQFPAGLACLLVAAIAASGAQVSPVQKIIQLLDDMGKKGKEEMATEQKQHDDLTKFCEDTLRDKRRSMSEMQEVIDQSTTDIEKNDASIQRLTTEIDDHQKEIESATKEKEDAIANRKEQAADFKKMDEDYTESITVTGKALSVVKAQAFNRAQESMVQEVESGSPDLSLLQLTENSSPGEAKRILASFLQQKQPKADGYAFQSNGVVTMLEDLKARFLREQQDMRNEEAKKINAHSVLIITLDGQIKSATISQEDEIGFRTAAADKLATAKTDLQEATTSNAADSKYSKDLKAECAKKTRDFHARQKLRKEELVALQQASDIIAGKSVLGASDKHARLLQLQSNATSLLSLSSPLRRPDLEKAMAIVQGAATELRSTKLSMVVEQASSLMQEEQVPGGAVRADNSVIIKIKDTMQQLLDKMNEQQQAEITQKYYCDKEMGQNKLKRAKKTEALESANAEIDALDTSITKLSQETTELAADITKIAGSMSEATKLRLEEKAENKVSVSEAQEAQKAVTQAMGVLQDFYEQAGQATAFTQIESEADNSEVQPQPYKGMQAAGGGVVSLLEAILEDFSRLEAETVASEESSAREHQEFMTDSKVDKAEKETMLANKKAKMETQQGTMAQRKTDAKLSEEQLDAANKEYQTLSDECLGKAGAAAEERAKREAEIKSLKEALGALGGSL